MPFCVACKCEDYFSCHDQSLLESVGCSSLVIQVEETLNSVLLAWLFLWLQLSDLDF